jgi:hypothetical protein
MKALAIAEASSRAAKNSDWCSLVRSFGGQAS